MVDPHKYDADTINETDSEKQENENEQALLAESNTTVETTPEQPDSTDTSSHISENANTMGSGSYAFSASSSSGWEHSGYESVADSQAAPSSEDPAPTPETPVDTCSFTKRLMNPYMAGVLLGLVLLLSYLTLGAGLGASGGIARVSATLEEIMIPGHVGTTSYFGAWGDHPWMYYLVFMFAGTFIGGLLSAVAGRRVRVTVERGRKCSASTRLIFALFGGILAGYASRIAHGCTSGQALSGGALLLTGLFWCLWEASFSRGTFLPGL